MSINYMPCDQSKLASCLKCKTKKEMGLRSMFLELFEGNADNKTSLSPVKKVIALLWAMRTQQRKVISVISLEFLM